MRIMSLVGARPQFIKEAVLHMEFQRLNIEEILVNSGQHYDHNMSDIFFDNFKIKKPDYNIGVGSGSHAEMTAKVMVDFEKIVVAEKPDWILVYGDTNTKLAGAIVASKLKVPLAHIEAGIRMLPKDMPEEINRTLTDKVSQLLFCASQRSVENLKNEGIESGVHFTGDVMLDIFIKNSKKFKYNILEDSNLHESEYCVLTLHRDYNVDNKSALEKILRQLKKLSNELQIIFPIHPRTKKNIENFSLQEYLKAIKTTEPLDYLSLMGLVSKSKFVITDSGGLQKESYYAEKPAILLMQDPAWHELVEEQINVLAGDHDLFDLATSLKYANFKKGIYGDGTAGKKIVSLIN